ncbi:glycosyltransferase family 4 protein [Mangrovimonas cancribranchiae]|uniref:Glycosyltransferase family 4 protein n=1 Tax=Mangrovimonas cancribranchiae TaxID=3080055 RepID=A0AAU6P2E1_9FLAO
MKLLLITHDTSRTGAPMVLLHLLRWLKQHHPQVMVDVLALKSGGLIKEFKANCDEFYDYQVFIKPEKPSLFKRVLFKFYNPTDRKKLLLNNLALKRYDVIYSNTVVTIPLANSIVSLSPKSKWIAHIHELNVIIKQLLPNIEDYAKAINKMIVPSKLVKANICEEWVIDKRKVDVVYECSNVDVISSNTTSKKLFTVGASGAVHWRKGHDMFIQVARYIKQHYPDVEIRFIWVGNISKNEQIIINEDLRKLKLKTNVSFIGEVENPHEYYQDFDVFLMTSREDPFPLVCIEVGQMGIPIICFEGATGTEEVVKKGGGFIVPYLNIEAMSEKVLSYYNDTNLKQNHGSINKIEFANFTPEVICKQLFKVIQTQI